MTWTAHLVPSDSGEALRLRGPISWEDIFFLLGQLPNRRAPCPDGILYELWKGAPEPLLQALFECIYAILELRANPG